MKNLVILVLIGAAGYYGYQQFFADDLASEIANKLHADAPMLDKSRLKSCAKQAIAGLTDAEKESVRHSLNNARTQINSAEDMAKMQTQMQVSMQVLGEVMSCIN